MSEKSKRRLGISIAAVLVLALIIAGALALLTGGSATAKQIATLRIMSGTVEVQTGGTGAFEAGTEGQALREGDTVRTGTDGRAAIEYFDGSITRMDFDTTFSLTTLETLDNDAGSKVIEAEQTSGNTYNRVAELTDSASRFDIETPTATASVQGTVYAVILNPDGSTTIAVIEGSVTATGSGGAVDVDAGMMVTIGADGSVGDPVPIPDDLLNSDWITFNQCDLDEIRDCVLGEVIEPEEEEEPPAEEEEPPAEPTDPPAPTDDGTTPPDDDDDDTPPPAGNAPPSAGFILGPGSGPAPHTISISDASSDPDGDPITRLWTFGDGSTHTGGTVLTHTYTEPGDYFLTLEVTDPSGASDTVGAVVHVTDGTAPVVEITSFPDDPSDSADASFSFTSSEAGTGFSCSLDGAPATGCGGSGGALLRDLLARVAGAPAAVNGSVTYADLDDGPHSFTVSVTDAAGNTGSASFAWEVDAVADLDHITLSPSASTIEVGQSQAYSVTAFDENGNSMGDVTGASTISGAGCSGGVCAPAVPGDFTITATFQGVSDTAQLHVLEPSEPGATFSHILVQPGETTIEYGGSQTYTAVAVDTDGGGMGDVTADTVFTGANCTGATCTPLSAGDKTVTGTYAGALGSDVDDALLHVTTKTLTVTADPASRAYGDANPALTFGYAGFVLGDGPSDLDVEPTCDTAIGPTDPAGVYPGAVACGGGVDGDYAFAYVDAGFTVTQAPVVVTADDKAKAFGAADPAFTFSADGLKNGESASVFDTQPTCGVGVAHSDIGTYPITCTGAADVNYSFSYVSGTLTVGTKATLTVTAQSETITYGDAEPAFTFAYDGFLGGDTAAVIDTPPTCSVAGAHTDAGSYTITCSGGSDNNYGFSYVSGTLTVEKKELVVTPVDEVIDEGDTPVLDFTYDGFVPGDGPGDIDVPPTCEAFPILEGSGELLAAPMDVGGLPAGSYAIYCTGGSDDNYELNMDAIGALTVLEAGGFDHIHLTGDTGSHLNCGDQRTFTATLHDGTHQTVDDDVTELFFYRSAGGGEIAFPDGQSVTVTDGVATVTVQGDKPGSVSLRAAAGDVLSDPLAFNVSGQACNAGGGPPGAASSGFAPGGEADRGRTGGYTFLGLMLPVAFGVLRRRHPGRHRRR